MLKELEDVLVLVRELPETWQNTAARDLGRVLQAYEEATFMSDEERQRLRELRSEETSRKAAALIDRIRRLSEE